MTESESNEIYLNLGTLCIMFNIKADKRRCELYCRRLDEYNFGDVSKALKKCGDGLKFFPQLSEIINFIDPPEDSRHQAEELSGKILDSARSFGRNRVNEAKENLGEVGWSSVESFGGWSVLCNLREDDLSSSRAQLREICKSKIEYLKKRGMSLRLNNRVIECKKENSMRLGDIFKEIDYQDETI